MTVKHMKWWGWGRDGVGFHHEDKPGFAPFVLQAVGLDLATAVPVSEPAFADLKVPKSKATASLVGQLTAIVGDEHVTKDDLVRVIHTYGKSLRDLVRIRGNLIERGPVTGVRTAVEIRGQFALQDNRIGGFDEPDCAALGLYPDRVGRPLPVLLWGNQIRGCSRVVTEAQPGLWAATQRRDNLFTDCRALPPGEGAKP